MEWEVVTLAHVQQLRSGFTSVWHRKPLEDSGQSILLALKLEQIAERWMSRHKKHQEVLTVLQQQWWLEKQYMKLTVKITLDMRKE